ncbi:MAG TPA: porin, partial [Mariniflexile sp.]|nr:porin [Mariniflexile sp.]
MKIKFSIVALLIYATTSLSAQDIKSPKFGKGLLNIVGQDSSWAMKVGLRTQFLSESVWEENQ